MKNDFSFGIIPIFKSQDTMQIYLVKHRSGGYWGFPKGHPEGNETPIETAVRELKEETGLAIVQLLPEPSFKESFTFQHKGEMIFKTVEYYIAFVSHEPVLQVEEVMDGKWVDIQAALDSLTYIEAKNVFNHAYKALQHLGYL